MFPSDQPRRWKRFGEIRLLYVRELRSALRERNIVINSLILPLVLYPALIWLVGAGITFVVGQSDLAISRVVITGLDATHEPFRQRLEDDEEIDLPGSAGRTGPALEEDVRRGRIDLVVDFTESARLASHVDLIHDGSRDRSTTARGRVQTLLRSYREDHLLELVRTVDVPLADAQQFWIERENMASGVDMGRFVMGLLIPLFMIVMLAVGGLYPAIDSTAGERENSTWETLMTISADRSSILLSKYLYVATFSFAAGMLNLAGMSLSFGTILRSLVGDSLGVDAFVLPWQAIPVITIGAALLALFIAAGMMILASFARTYKEGQSLVGPFYIAVFFPVLFLQAPDIDFNLNLALIPVVNVTMMFRQAIGGIYQWDMIAVTVLVEMATIGLMLLLAGRILRDEDVVLGSYPHHFGRFLKQRILGRR